MKIGLAHVCIETDDIVKTEAFYGILGMRRQFEFRNLTDELVGVYLSFGNGTYIEIIKNSTPGESGRIRHFAIEVDSVDETSEVLRGAGVDVTNKELAIDHTWIISCHDPNGVFIELQEYTERSMQRVGGRCEVDYTP